MWPFTRSRSRSRSATATRRPQASQRRFKPSFESLESRITPDAKVTTLKSTLNSMWWDDALNWDNGVPTYEDMAVLGTTDSDIYIRDTREVAVLNMSNNFSKKLVLEENLPTGTSLTLRGTTNSDWHQYNGMGGGDLVLEANSHFNLHAGTWTWNEGNIKGTGTFEVNGSGELKITDEAFRFDPVLDIIGSGLVRFDDALDDHVQFQNTIKVRGDDGELIFEGTKGVAFFPQASMTIEVRGDGRVQFLGDTTIEAPVHVYDDGELLFWNADVTFQDNLFLEDHGIIRMVGSTTIDADLELAEYAALIVDWDEIFSAASATIVGGLTVNNYALVDLSVAGSYLSIDGYLDWNSGTLAVTLSDVYGMSGISTTGNADITGMEIKVYWYENPSNNATFTVIDCGGTLTTSTIVIWSSIDDYWDVDLTTGGKVKVKFTEPEM